MKQQKEKETGNNKDKTKINEIENKNTMGETTKPKVRSLRRKEWLNCKTFACQNNVLQ